MMRCAVIYMDGRLYRYSLERHTSGRPKVIQFQNRQKLWRDVRSVDQSDRIWLEADEGNLTPLYFEEAPALKQARAFDEETGEPVTRLTVPLKDRTDAEISADIDALIQQVVSVTDGDAG